jgi:hypothetical protein
MVEQKWYREKRIWRLPPPAEPTRWHIKGEEFVKEAERRKDKSINQVNSIYDKLFDISI